MATFYTYKNKKGEKRYKFKVYLGTHEVTGKRIETSRQGFKTKKEAQIALTKLQMDFHNNGLKKRDNMTVDDVFNEWFESYKLTVKETTALNRLERYRYLFKDDLGYIKINNIDSVFLQRYVNKMSKQMYSYRHALTVLHMVFVYAFKHKIIKENPFNYIEYPKTTAKPKTVDKADFLNKDELMELLDILKDEKFEMYVMVRLLAFSGMRIGECLALKWSDIEDNVIHINKTLVMNKETHKVYVTEPKTKGSNRDITIDDTTLDLLNQWHNITNNQIIFPSQTGSYQYSPRIYAFFRRFYRHHNNIKVISPHSLRHTHASLLFESGASMKDVQVRLGHSNINTTMNIYTHVTKSRESDTINRFFKFMDK